VTQYTDSFHFSMSYSREEGKGLIRDGALLNSIPFYARSTIDRGANFEFTCATVRVSKKYAARLSPSNGFFFFSLLSVHRLHRCRTIGGQATRFETRETHSGDRYSYPAFVSPAAIVAGSRLDLGRVGRSVRRLTPALCLSCPAQGGFRPELINRVAKEKRRSIREIIGVSRARRAIPRGDEAFRRASDVTLLRDARTDEWGTHFLR